MRARINRLHRHPRAGFSLLEVIIALAILISGIIGILYFYPPTLRASNEAALRSRAALLAQSKAEELRRDSDASGLLLDAIATLATPTTPLPFPEDNRLTYQYFSQSLRVPDGDPGNPEFAPGVPRIIIRMNPSYFGKDDILFELRFDYSG